MKQKQITAYWCDHCNKLYQRKHACEKHEANCTNNPKNHNACFHCSHCEKIDLDIEVLAGNNNGPVYKSQKSFQFNCTKLDKLMFPFSAKKWAAKFPDSFEEQVQMPNICAHQEDGSIKAASKVNSMKVISNTLPSRLLDADIPF